MRIQGTLSKWNDDRGFGFIASAQGGDDIFVHISAFPRDGSRPSVNEPVSFEVEIGEDGKKRAVSVLRPGHRNLPERTPRGRPSKPRRKPLAIAMGLLVVGMIVMSAYSRFWPNGFPSLTAPAFEDEFANDDAEPVEPAQTFRCDGRTHCSQMTSCAEATYFLRHCPNTQMDGDGDGEPCERQWCQ